MIIACRGREREDEVTQYSIEDLIRDFLHRSFDSDFVYIISPWITNFSFSDKFIHYPWVSTRDSLDIIKALRNKGVEVKVLTRCFDDALRLDVLSLINSLQSVNISGEVRRFIRSQLEDLLDGIETSLKLHELLGNDLLFDLGGNYHVRDRNRRLHTKLYINNEVSLIGSANFTGSGILDSVPWSNWECLIRISSTEEQYKELLNVARRYLEDARDFRSCEDRFVSILGNYGNLIPTTVRSLEDVINVLEDVIDRL